MASTPAPAPSQGANIAGALRAQAAARPDAVAIYHPRGARAAGDLARYRAVTYRELDDDSDRIARGLGRLGLAVGDRVAVLVKPSPELFSLTFGLFKAGAVPVMIDPGIGLRPLGRCLDDAAPRAFVGVPQAHLARLAFGWGARTVKTLVTVGRRGPWGGVTLDDVRNAGAVGASPGSAGAGDLPEVSTSDPAAVLFTSGSTGAPKGALYTHGTFAAQVDMLRDAFGIEPGEIDLPTFPLFALFDPALGMTTVLPHMDATRPGFVDPREIIEPVRAFGVTNLFGSPALLRRVGFSREAEGARLPTLRRVISAGAPVPAPVIERFVRLLAPGVQMFTPYGATEALPVAVVGSDEILGETRARTDGGEGVCVGRPVAGVRVAIVRIDDGALEGPCEALRAAPGQMGEIVVAGPNVTRGYAGRDEATRLSKIVDGDVLWHRMGDVGYFDERGRLWYGGRRTHRVEARGGTMFTEQVEALFNTHPLVARSALVGVRGRVGAGPARAVLCVEPSRRLGPFERRRLVRELLARAAGDPRTRDVERVLVHPGFPVDIRHNAKIFREKLAAWAEGEVGDELARARVDATGEG